MTVPTLLSRIQYIGNGSSTEFDFPFQFQNDEDVKVVELTAGDSEYVLPLGTHYAVSRPGGTGGRISLSQPLANGHKLTIYRDPAPLQQIDFEENQRYYLETTEQGLDFATMIAQRHRELFDRSLVLRESDVNGAGRYDAKSNRITNLAAAIADSDAVTLAQLRAYAAGGGGNGGGTGGGPIIISPEQLQQITDTVLQSAALAGLLDPINGQIGNLSQDILGLDSQVGSLGLSLTGLTTQLGTLQTTVGGINTRLTSTEATVATLAAISGDAGALVALVTTETTARINGDNALSAIIAKIGALSGDNTAFILNLDTAKVSPTETLAQRFSGITASFTATNAAITAGDAANAAAITAGDQANANAIASTNAAISTEATARANADSSLAQQITTLQSSVGTLTTSLQVTAAVVDGIQAKYTVKIDNNGYVTGYGLISTSNNGAPTSQFTVLADRFAVILPGQPARIPFIAGNLGGSPGVGINGALIVDGTISATAILARTITADRIVAGSLTANELANLAVTGSKIADATITGSKIVAGSIAADRLSVAQLSALSADLGLVTAGLIRMTSGSYRLELGVDSGYLMWSGTGAKNDTNAKFFLKPDGSAYFGGTLAANLIASDNLQVGAATNVVAATGSDQNLTNASSDVEVTLASLSITTIGGKVLLQGAVSVTLILATTASMVFRIYRGTTLLRSYPFFSAFANGIRQPLFDLDSPAAGTYTYSVRVVATISGSQQFQYASPLLVATELRR